MEPVVLSSGQINNEGSISVDVALMSLSLKLSRYWWCYPAFTQILMMLSCLHSLCGTVRMTKNVSAIHFEKRRLTEYSYNCMRFICYCDFLVTNLNFHSCCQLVCQFSFNIYHFATVQWESFLKESITYLLQQVHSHAVSKDIRICIHLPVR